MFGLGMQELIVILVVALLLFGAKRLPEIGRSIGKAITSFKAGIKDDEDPSDGKSTDDSDSSKKS